MKNNKFNEVDIKEYVREGLRSGLLKPQKVVKVAKVYARQGVLGETIKTIGLDCFNETINTVKKDKNGNLDWVVTDSFFNSYVVADSIFRKKYDVGNKKSGMFKPIFDPIVAIQVHENIKFIAPWKEKMYVRKGGYVIINSETDIYGIHDEVFLSSYRFYNDPIETLKKEDIKYREKYYLKVYNLAS